MKIRAERRQEAEREMHARAKWLETWSSGGGISGKGERGGMHSGLAGGGLDMSGLVGSGQGMDMIGGAGGGLHPPGQQFTNSDFGSGFRHGGGVGDTHLTRHSMHAMGSSGGNSAMGAGGGAMLAAWSGICPLHQR